MNEEAELLRAFYTCFEQLDWRGMNACYHEDVFFYDPVFGDLEGVRVRAMWQMLLSNAKDLQLRFSDIVAADDYGSCHWVATYRFSGTGRRVVNNVSSHFKFTDGKIIEQQDVFSLWKWSSQALGIPGILFGWNPPLQNKIRNMAKKTLKNSSYPIISIPTIMFNRRKFLRSSLLSSFGLVAGGRLAATGRSGPPPRDEGAGAADVPGVVLPLVISTWNIGLEANRAAWQILHANGRALDAVEAGVNLTEASLNCCVGLSANPDREGIVTLDACIMDEIGNCGSVAFLERIKHPVSVARRVMEKTPHVMLVGSGAQAFALAEGFPLEEQKLSDTAKKAYEEWLRRSGYNPAGGELNHDTIGMLAMDAAGNLSGCCSTSGTSFKLRGRVGDSPIIGAGLFVDNEVGAATATGMGEEMIRICGTHTVVELMRQGLSPEEACKAAVERVVRKRKDEIKSTQVAFLAMNKRGEVGAFSLQKGFCYALKNNTEEKLIVAASWFL